MRIASVRDRKSVATLRNLVPSTSGYRLITATAILTFGKQSQDLQLPGFTPFSTSNQNEEARRNAASGRISVHDGTRPERLGMGVPAPQPRLPCRCGQDRSPTGGCASAGRLGPSLGVAKSWRTRTAA